MPASPRAHKFDAAVIGSGISGLTAGISLQLAGVRTLILERRSVAGGLCGTFELDGYEFVIGCNDFGYGIRRCLKSLGVNARFLTPKGRFYLGDTPIDFPPNFSTMVKVGRRMPRLLSAVSTARKSREQTVGQIIDRSLHDRLLADLACVPVYGIMRSPDDVTIKQIRQMFSAKFNYDLHKSCTPVGGPGAMIEAMVQRFEQLGGRLLLNCECLKVEKRGAEKHLSTTTGIVQAKTALSSEGRWQEFPAGTKAGIEVALLLFAVHKSFQYPLGYHTIACFQPGIAQELRDLDAGRGTSRPSFHIFRSDLADRRGSYTINCLIPLPRGERSPSRERQNALAAHVVATIDTRLPGFRKALTYQRFLSPAEYESRFGLRSAPSPYVPPTPFKELPNYDTEHDIHFIGTSVNPPGEHAVAACVSGVLGARLAISRLRGI